MRTAVVAHNLNTLHTHGVVCLGLDAPSIMPIKCWPTTSAATAQHAKVSGTSSYVTVLCADGSERACQIWLEHCRAGCHTRGTLSARRTRGKSLVMAKIRGEASRKERCERTVVATLGEVVVILVREGALSA